jgi:hypothetical protein
MKQTDFRSARDEYNIGHLCRQEFGDPRFLLPLRGIGPTAPLAGLLRPRLERAIGVIYRPETELQSHYFEAVLPRQFDEFV